MSGDVDAVSRLDPCRPLYVEVVDRIEALAGRADVLGGGLVDRLVPACPSWTGRDLLGHLTGIAQDWVAGRLESYASTHWTAEHVARNAQLSLPDLMAAWRTAVGELGTTHHPQLGAPWRWLFGDALIHEADLYEASGLGGGPPEPAIQVAFGQIVGRWRHEVVGASAGSRWPGLLLVDPARRSWSIDSDHTAERRAPEAADRSPVAVSPLSVKAPVQELWRMLTGRLSLDEIRALDWSDDPSPVFDRALPFPFRLAVRDAPSRTD